MLTCDYCHAVQPGDDLLYCVNCGKQLEAVTRVRTTYTPGYSAGGQVPVPISHGRTSPVPWILAGIFAVVATGAIMYVVMRSPATETAKAATPTPTVESTPTKGMTISTPMPVRTAAAPSLPTENSNSGRPQPTPADRPRPNWAIFECNDGSFSNIPTMQACDAHRGIRRQLKALPTPQIIWPSWATALCNDGQFTDYHGSFNLCGAHNGVKVRRP